MTTLGYDFHLHTKFTDADPGMEVATIVPAAEKLGVTHLGITDHLHSLAELPLHQKIREALVAQTSKINLYFGVEVDIGRRYAPLYFDRGIKEAAGFQFAIAGLHMMLHEACDWPRIVSKHHERHLAACRDPAIDVLAHPYWFPCGFFLHYGWPMVQSMEMVPKSCIRELAAASRETGTAIEINAGSCLEFFCWPDSFKQGYRDYVGELAAEGAVFSLGSDAHHLNHLPVIREAWALADKLGLGPDQVWKPAAAPLNAG